MPLSPSHSCPSRTAACLESRHLTEGRLRAAYSFFDRQGRGGITQGDVAQVGRPVELKLLELCWAAPAWLWLAGRLPRQ